MSCAFGGTGPSGGRRSTSSAPPKRTRYVRFEWPPGNCETSQLARRGRGRRSRRRRQMPRADRPRARVQSSCSVGRTSRVSPVHGRARLSCAPCASTSPNSRRRWPRASPRSWTSTSIRTKRRSAADRRRRSLAADRHRRGAEAEGARGRAVEPVPAGERVRRRPDEPRVRAALRDHGPLAGVRARGLQLLGARHRQHGSAGALRHRPSSGSSGSSRCSPARSARASR